MTSKHKRDPAILVQGYHNITDRQTDTQTDPTHNINVLRSKKAVDQDEQEMFQLCDLLQNTINTEEMHLGLLTVSYHD